MQTSGYTNIAAKVKNCPGVRLKIPYPSMENSFAQSVCLAKFILQSLPQILTAHYTGTIMNWIAERLILPLLASYRSIDAFHQRVQ